MPVVIAELDDDDAAAASISSSSGESLVDLS